MISMQINSNETYTLERIHPFHRIHPFQRNSNNVDNLLIILWSLNTEDTMLTSRTLFPRSSEIRLKIVYLYYFKWSLSYQEIHASIHHNKVIDLD